MTELLDVNAISNFSVAVGTIVLAILAYLSIRQNKEQLKILLRQNLLLKSQQNPILSISGVKFNGNIFEAVIKNMGTGVATNMGLETNFYPAKVSPIDESDRILDVNEFRNILEIGAKEGKKFQEIINERGIKFTYQPIITTSFQYEGIKMTPSGAVKFLINHEKMDAILLPNEEKIFEAEPIFFIRGTDSMKGLNFDELKKLLEQHNIDFAGLRFNIVSKDIVENPVLNYDIGTFIFDVKSHLTIEDVFNAGIRAGFVGLSHNQIVNEIGWVDSKFYEAKSYYSSPEMWEKNIF
jgi:hypothetical protein